MRSLLHPGTGDLTDRDLAAAYDYPMNLERPWVRAVFVASADGAGQGPDHVSGSLSGPGDRRVFELQRSLCDVVLVGAGTARAEHYRPVAAAEVDPALRASLGLSAIPPLAIVTRSGVLDTDLLSGGAVDTLLLPELDRAVGDLAALGHRRILCEGGPSLVAQLAAAGQLDELCLTLSPLLTSGPATRILTGPQLVPTRTLQLAELLEDDGFLFARYLVSPSV